MDLSHISLDAVGIVALADLTAVARRTALTGTSALLDCLVLCPGLHRQQEAPKLNGGEYPICAAMTTGYVFRVENQATVAFLQRVGRTGKLTTVAVSPRSGVEGVVRSLRPVYDVESAGPFGVVWYFYCVSLTLTVLGLLVHYEDWWGVLAVGVLVFARLVNVLILQRRSVEGWKGEAEGNERSDLIVLMSQDRWVRVRGGVNDVKAVTSGAWLRELTLAENVAVGFATLMVYLDVALAGNATVKGKVLLLLLLFGSAGFLGLCNEYTEGLKMYGRWIEVSGARKSYRRRLHLAEELIKETGKREWALKLGMVNEEEEEEAEPRRQQRKVIKEL